MSHYDVGLACLNGHAINSSSDTQPEHNSKFCSECGEPTIHECPQCGVSIRGYCYVEGVITLSEWEPASHCYECGSPYPWVQRRSEALAEVVDELDELKPEERDRLKKSIPDILTDTPRTETAVHRFKKAAAKIGKTGGKLLTDVLSKVATEAVKSSMGL